MRRAALHRAGGFPTLYSRRYRAALAAAGLDQGIIIMWGFVADSAAGHLCRGYEAALGHLPAACQSNSGTPALAITLIGVLAVLVCAGLVFNRLRPAR